MKVICEITSILKNNKINQAAKTQIEKLKETDSLVIVSETEEISVNTEILSILFSSKAQISIIACPNRENLLIEIGIAIGMGEKILLAIDNYSITKNSFKAYPYISFGWDSNSKTAGARQRKPKESVKKEEINIKPEIKSETKAKKEEKTMKFLTKDLNTLEKIMGKNYSAEDYENMLSAIYEATDDSENALGFICKIRLPLICNDKDFAEKIKIAYSKIKK